MQSNNETNKDKPAEPTTPKTEEPLVVFSQEETKAIVKEFLKAYIGGQLETRFASADEMMNIAKLEKNSLDFATAQRKEIQMKTSFINMMHICLGTTEASEKEMHQAIKDMMDLILSLRSSQRLKGQFLTFNAEKQINELREDINVINTLVNQIILSLRSGVSKI